MLSSRENRAITGLLSMMLLLSVETADASLNLTITHAPPSQTAAGEPLKLQAVVASTCTLNCASIRVDIYYEQPWGPPYGFATASGVSSPSGTLVEFTIPPNSVRYPSFSYYLVARQGSWSQRSPSTGQHTVPVNHQVEAQFVKDDGTPLAGASWKLQLIDTIGPDVGSTGLAGGTTDAVGKASIVLPVTHSNVVALAAENDGYANFEISVWDLDLPLFYSTAVKLYANISDLDQFASTSGVEQPPGPYEAPLCDITGTSESQDCKGPGYNQVPCEFRDDYIPGPLVNSIIGHMHIGYDMRGEYEYGATADSNLGFALRRNFGSWVEGAGKLHIGNEMGSPQSLYPHAAHTLEKHRAEVYRVKSRFETYQRKFRNLVHTPDGYVCYVQEEDLPGAWHPVSGPEDPIEPLTAEKAPTPHEWDDCLGSCTTQDNKGEFMEAGSDYQRTDQTQLAITGSICFTFVCAEGQHGWRTNSHLKVIAGTLCPSGWWAYDTTGTNSGYARAGRVFVDAGIQGRSSYLQNGQSWPQGCNPPA